MNKKLIHSICIALVIVAAISCTTNRIKLPPLKETFSHLDKNPFGTYVLHNQLEQLYSNNSIRTLKNKFETTWQEISDTNSLYINVSKNLFLTQKDLDGMLEYVYNGNTLFISSDNIDRRLLDTLGCTVSKPFYDQLIREMKYTSVKVAAEIYGDSVAYQYFYVPFYNHFTKFDKKHSRALGHNKSGYNFMVVFYGKGRFYLHLEPRALSNYFLLQKDNYKYFQHVFSLTPSVPEHVYWDDYYNKKNYPRAGSGNNSGLAVLLRYPAMAWAFWLLVLLFALYVFFGGKRRQRIVQTIPPNTNTTITFTETIGRLYLQKKDNRNIADKLITYFLEYIRNQYYLNTSHIDDAFITTLSRKSNNTKDGTERLFNFIDTLQQSTEVTDEQMLSLNQQIENFHKNKI
ncbi:MAG: hypothetical protein JWP81_2379 [Ferruginibacter sp.]|nr:hypothetical protein [Ferruginibacter sp.]